jgi:hypothetical protein
MNRKKMAFEHLHRQAILHTNQMVAENSLPISGMRVYVVRMAVMMRAMVVAYAIMYATRVRHRNCMWQVSRVQVS